MAGMGTIGFEKWHGPSRVLLVSVVLDVHFFAIVTIFGCINDF